jgi:hypothetical protein
MKKRIVLYLVGAVLVLLVGAEALHRYELANTYTLLAYPPAGNPARPVGIAFNQYDSIGSIYECWDYIEHRWGGGVCELPAHSLIVSRASEHQVLARRGPWDDNAWVRVRAVNSGGLWNRLLALFPKS